MRNEVNFRGKKYYFKTWEGRRWLRLVYHNSTAADFSNENEALYSMNPNKYSILSELTDALKVNKSFEFHLEYSSYAVHWKQNDNPLLIDENDLNSGEVDGLVVFQNNGMRFTGLARSTIKYMNVICTLLDGNSNSLWWYAVGMYSYSRSVWLSQYIPGAGTTEEWMSLRVRVPNNFCMFNSRCQMRESSMNALRRSNVLI